MVDHSGTKGMEKMENYEENRKLYEVMDKISEKVQKNDCWVIYGRFEWPHWT